MNVTIEGRSVPPRVWVALAILVGVTVIAVATGLWVLTAIPVGFLFGLFLQKGDLCGASACSEVVAMRDGRKLFGVWVVIVVSMLGFALLDVLGWVALNPKPMLWLSFLVGGVVFGVGTVLAGGCVSGCLFKAGTGNLNSMAGLVGIPIGVALVEYGPLGGAHSYLKTFIIKGSEGRSVTFPSVTGLPFWLLAVAFAVVTVVVAILVRGSITRRAAASVPSPDGHRLQRWLTRPWKPWHAGVAIGLLGIPAYLSSAASGRNYPLGVTHGVLQVEALAFDRNFKHVWRQSPNPSERSITGKKASAQGSRAPADAATAHNPKKIVWWLVALVTSLVAGSWFSGTLSGQTRLLPKPPDETVVAFVGGILVGVGAAFATGCVIGNIMLGIGLMSVGLLVFTGCTILANWVTTYFYLMGGGLSGSR